MVWSTSSVYLAVLVPLAVVTVDIIQRAIHNRIERKGCPLPPGPTPLPLIGSILSVDKKTPWLTYLDWKAKYGDIMHVQLLDSNVIILNSTRVARDLLEKRSHIYSDRPFIATVNPFGHDFDFGFSRYGDHWRLCRRILHQTFRAEAAVSFHAMQLRRARQIVVNMIDAPEECQLHFATFSSATTMSAVYDYEPTPRNDPMVTIVDHFLQASIPALMSETTLLLKVFPFCECFSAFLKGKIHIWEVLHIPDWLPGSYIKREARVACEWRNKMLETPYQYVKERMASGDQMNDAMVPDHITRMEKLNGSYRSDYETALKHASATALIGATESTSSSFLIFTLAMVENPHVWKRAQAEIDAAIGTDRLPEFGDRQALPYVDAIVRETLRWHPVVPMGVPHATTRSDIYDGYYIPKGSTVMYNAWAMSRDESRYPDPEKFIPERFLNADGGLSNDNPANFVFGFGRRICPGRHTTDASLWSAIATMLATLDFNRAKDVDGNDIIFTATFENGMAHHPNPFPCRIALRPHLSKDVLTRAVGTQ